MKSIIRYTISILILYTCFSPLRGRTQESVGIYDTLYSAPLKEKRPVQIFLPSGYKADSTTRYDVMYVLDGEWNTSLAVTVRHFLAYGKFIPDNIIIVSVPNLYKGNDNLRDRDFSPTATNGRPMSGGAANFLAFLKQDLLPYIKKKYPTNPESNTLYGTSLGGLFAVYAFLQEPLLFRSYLTVEPSLYWDNGYMYKLASEKLNAIANVQATLWIASRDGKAYRDMGIYQMDSILKIKAPKSLDWKIEAYPNETHFSSIWKGIYDGYKFIYKGMIPEGGFSIAPMNGRVVKGKPFKLHCFNTGPENYMHYTTDGSEPTKISPRLQQENRFKLSESTVITIKSIGGRKENERRIQCQFIVDEQPMAPIVKPSGLKEGGLNYKYYQGDWNQLTDIRKVKPAAKGIARKNFNINDLSSQQGFAGLLEGFVEIPKEGYYFVEMNGKHNTKIWVGQQPVIEGEPAKTELQNFMIYLQKGFYPYKIAYLQKKGDPPLRPVRWLQENGQTFSEAAVKFLYR